MKVILLKDYDKVMVDILIQKEILFKADGEKIC